MLTMNAYSRNPRSRTPRQLALAAGFTLLVSTGLVGFTPANAGAAPGQVRAGLVWADDDPGDPIVIGPIVIDPEPVPDPGDGGDGGGDGDDGGDGGGVIVIPVPIPGTDEIPAPSDPVPDTSGSTGSQDTKSPTKKHKKPKKKHQGKHQNKHQGAQHDDAAVPTTVASPYVAAVVDPPILAAFKRPAAQRLPAAAVAPPMATQEEPEARGTPQPQLTTAERFRTMASETAEPALSLWVPGALLLLLSGLVGNALWRRREHDLGLRDL